jgi:alanyl-tRNA synthetase
VTTERLYYSDSYLTRFSASVVGREEGGRRVYLDRTAFYPTSGGQPFDTGELSGSRVLDVVDEDDRIAHLLERPVVGPRVDGIIDWPRRFDHMQQHTGQHLLSAVLADQFGWQTVSVHFGAETATLDLDVGTVTGEQIRQAELRGNAVATENRPVAIGFEDARSATGLRKASDREGTIRIVTIADLDRSACGGTHVRATGEIGPILIRKAERVKKQVRLEFLCGLRAVARARADFDVLTGLASAVSASIEDLPALFGKQQADLKSLESSRRLLEERLHGYRAGELYLATAPNRDGRRRIVHRESAGSVEALRGLAQAVITHPDVVFLATLASPPTVLLATSPDTGVDAGRLLKPILDALGGKGGGSTRLAQGTVPGEGAIETALANLASAVTTAS